jgi:hypothetical protein
MTLRETPLTLRSENTKMQLSKLVENTKQGGTYLLDLKKQVAELKNGISVVSLSENARNQLRALLDLSSTARDRIMQIHVRKALAFPEIRDRWEAIDGTFPGNYEWLFEDDNSPVTEVKLDARKRYSKWLVSGCNIFHIAGKLGSGKSTLMKYLSGHSGTRNQLLQWAGKPSSATSAPLFY